MNIHISLLNFKKKKISPKKAINFINSKKNGAECIFIGRVRNKNDGSKVKAVTYELHKNMVLKSFDSICRKAIKKFDRNARIFLEHSVGYVPVGKISIIIAVGTGHRNEAYKICRYVLEEIKYHSPIWKKEHYIKGISNWLRGTSLRHKKVVK